MKKLFITLLAVLMVAVLSFSAIAAPQGFVNSPEVTPGPEIEDFENETEDCPAELVITPYSERETLPDELDDQIVDAYEDLTTTDDLTTLTNELAVITHNLNIPASELAVSDLFDIHYESCDVHAEHGSFRIRLKPEALQNFVGLMHFHNGVWHMVEGARVENGEYLVFSIKDFSPFAIIVHKDGASADSPLTGFFEDYGKTVCLVTVMSVSLVACIVLWKKSKKQAA